VFLSLMLLMLLLLLLLVVVVFLLVVMSVVVINNVGRSLGLDVPAVRCRIEVDGLFWQLQQHGKEGGE